MNIFQSEDESKSVIIWQQFILPH